MIYKIRQYQIVKFLFVGVLNTIVGYSLFALFIFLDFHYTIATLLATLLGVLFNFKSIGTIVFQSHNNRLIFKFILTYIIIYLLNIFGLYILQTLGYTDMYINGLVLIMPLAIISFLLNKYFVFGAKT
jgi:putative flippase GtrA